MDVLADQSVEQHLVVVVQVGEERPLVDVGLARVELLERAGDLLLDRLDTGGQQTVQPEVIALVGRECRAPVDLRVLEHIQAACADVDGLRPVGRLPDREMGGRHWLDPSVGNACAGSASGAATESSPIIRLVG